MDPIISRWQAANSTLLDRLPSLTRQIQQSRLDDKARLEAAVHQQHAVEAENAHLRQKAAEGDKRIRQMSIEGEEKKDQLVKALGESHELQVKLAQALKENKEYGEKVINLGERARVREMQLQRERRDIDQKHERKLAQREAEHHQTVDQIATQHQKTLSALQLKHSADISTIHDEHAGTTRRISDLEDELEKAQAKANEYRGTARQWRVLSEELRARMVDIAEGNVSVRLVDDPAGR